MKFINKKLFITIMFSVVISLYVNAQQESQYTQYMYNTGSINPAYVGSNGTFDITSFYRDQWTGINGSPKTLSLTVGKPIGEKIGIGLSFVQDEIGPSDESTISADFSYSLPLGNETNLAFGIKGGINLLNVDYSVLNIDPDNVFQYNIEDRLSPIVGAGVYIYNKEWYFGLSVPNMLKTTHYDDSSISNASEQAHFYLMGGYVFNINNDFKLKPSVLSKFSSGAPLTLDIATNLLMYEKFSLGVSYRFDTSVNALAGFQITDQIMVGYSFDYSTSNLRNYSSGSHEVFLKFELKRFDRCDCISPRFF